MTTYIINLTQHTATPEQLAVGVIEPTSDDKKKLVELLTIKIETDLRDVAYKIAQMASTYKCSRALIGGYPPLITPLEHALVKVGIDVYYAHIDRVSVETIREDNTVFKKCSFKHPAFVKGYFTKL